MLERANELLPQHESLLNRGKAAIDNFQYTEGIQHIEDAIRLYNETLSSAYMASIFGVETSFLADAYGCLGVAYLFLEQFQKMQTYSNKAIELDASCDKRYYACRSARQYLKKNQQQAITDLTRYIDQEWSSFITATDIILLQYALLARGLSYYTSDDLMAAESDLTKLIDLSERYNTQIKEQTQHILAKALFNRSKIRLQHLNTQGSAEDHQRAIKLDPSLVNAPDEEHNHCPCICM